MNHIPSLSFRTSETTPYLSVSSYIFSTRMFHFVLGTGDTSSILLKAISTLKVLKGCNSILLHSV